jgi:hypothetical protein
MMDIPPLEYRDDLHAMRKLLVINLNHVTKLPRPIAMQTHGVESEAIQPPLGTSAQEGRDKVVKIFLPAAAKLDAQDVQNRPALHFAGLDGPRSSTKRQLQAFYGAKKINHNYCISASNDSNPRMDKNNSPRSDNQLTY